MIPLSSNFTDKLRQREDKQLAPCLNSLYIYTCKLYLHKPHFQKYQWQASTDRRKSRCGRSLLFKGYRNKPTSKDMKWEISSIFQETQRGKHSSIHPKMLTMEHIAENESRMRLASNINGYCSSHRTVLVYNCIPTEL